MFKIEKAKREAVFLKLGLSGVSGSGKTLSALKLARGLCDSWDEIIVIDTENASASLYSELGDYSVINFPPPFTPQRYCDAIAAAVAEKPKVLVIDSVSPEWSGSGGALDMKSAIPGNEFAAWGKITPIHNKFVQTILQTQIHTVVTLRKKTDYVLETNDRGKAVPRKVGLKHEQREGFDYELTIDFEIDQSHKALASKDRTGIFALIDVPFVIDESTGHIIRQWNGTPILITPSFTPSETNLTPLWNALKKQGKNIRERIESLADDKVKKQLTSALDSSLNFWGVDEGEITKRFNVLESQLDSYNLSTNLELSIEKETGK